MLARKGRTIEPGIWPYHHPLSPSQGALRWCRQSRIHQSLLHAQALTERQKDLPVEALQPELLTLMKSHPAALSALKVAAAFFA